MSERVLERVCVGLAALCACAGLIPAGHDAGDGWPATAPAAGTLRVVVWNVGTGDGHDGGPLPGELQSSVIAVLQRLDFDLACLVELRDRAQAEDVAQALGCGQDAWLSSRGGEGRPLLLLARRGTLRGRRPAPEVDWPRGPDVRAHRLATWTVASGGVRIELAAVHASPWSAAARNQLIGAAAAHLTAVGADAALLLGDLNLDVAIEGRQDVFSDDAHRDVETYGFVTRTLHDVGRSAGATAEPDRRIDYVLASPALPPRDARVVRVARVGAMDHAPLWGDLRWGDRQPPSGGR